MLKVGCMKAFSQVAKGEGFGRWRRGLVRVLKRPRGRVWSSVRSRGKRVSFRGRERLVG